MSWGKFAWPERNIFKWIEQRSIATSGFNTFVYRWVVEPVNFWLFKTFYSPHFYFHICQLHAEQPVEEIYVFFLCFQFDMQFLIRFHFDLHSVIMMVLFYHRFGVRFFCLFGLLWLLGFISWLIILLKTWQKRGRQNSV
jgi:hypothetical protein